MLPEERRGEIVATFLKMEAFVPEGKNGASIGEMARKAVETADRLSVATDALMPVLRTALVINWKESAMKSRYERFRCKFPEITTLAALKDALDKAEPVHFCEHYLRINATNEQNPKYKLLKGLTKGFLDYQRDQGIGSEIEAIRHWAAHVDVARLDADPIGGIRGVGPGVVGNIRLNLGLDAIKPDRHVIGVMKQHLLLDVPHHCYGKVAEWLGIGKRRFDEVLFRYGQAHGISG